MLIASRYAPRTFFMPFHLRKQRWAILVAHRRAGKTVAAVNDLIEKASYNTREAPRYAYIAPLLKQAKAIAWEYLKRFAAPFNPKISEAELYVELTALPNSPRITIYGADNPDSFRGLYFDGVVLDEYGNMLEVVWREVLLPALIDRRGWAVFMGTPNGPNHFRDMWYVSQTKPETWYTCMLRVDQTNVISEEELLVMREEMEPEQYEQEMMCNFEASVRGAIYARQMQTALEENRIGDFPLDASSPVDLTMDLGHTDQSVQGFSQRRFDGILLGASYADNMRPISYYINHALAFWAGSAWPDPLTRVREGARYKAGQVYLPHDAKAKTLQTGKTIIDHFRAAGPRGMPKPKLVPKLEILDGIAAVRLTFPLLYIHKPLNETLILAAKTYHRKYDAEMKRYSEEAVHDWSSDWMDMVRYLCIMNNPKAVVKVSRTAPRPVEVPPEGGMSYGFCLNDIWDLGPRTQNRRPYG